jgi:hypothetical protein
VSCIEIFINYKERVYFCERTVDESDNWNKKKKNNEIREDRIRKKRKTTQRTSERCKKGGLYILRARARGCVCMYIYKARAYE